MVRIGYGQLDSIAAWMVDEYFDLEPRQKGQFLARFDRLYQWHRYEQLPDYAAFLDETRVRLQRGLTREQEAHLAALVGAMPEVAQLRHEDRIRRQREFLAVLELRGNRAVFDNRLRYWLLNWEEGRAPEYERRYRQWLAMRVDLLVAVDRMLTPQQRANAAGRLQRYAEDFRSLSRPRGTHASTH